MGKKKENYNPFDVIPDDQFEKFLYNIGHNEPRWIECSKEEYEANCPTLDFSKPENRTSEYIIKAMSNWGDYKKEAIIKGGLFNTQIIGYRYFRREGYKRVLVIGSQMAGWIANKREKIKKNKSQSSKQKLKN